MEATSRNEASVDRVIRDGARDNGPALESWYRFLLWLVPTLERFPCRQKFLLGDRIQSTALDILEALIEATCTRNRESHLARANLRIEKLRFFVRLAMDLGVPGPAPPRACGTGPRRDRAQGRCLEECSPRPRRRMTPPYFQFARHRP